MRIIAAAGEGLTGAALGRSRLKLGGLDRGIGAEGACEYHTDLLSAGDLGVSSGCCAACYTYCLYSQVVLALGVARACWRCGVSSVTTWCVSHALVWVGEGL